MSATEVAEGLAARQNGHRAMSSYGPTWRETKSGKKELVLAPLPDHEDRAGLCAWLTASLALNPALPVTGGWRLGPHGRDSIAVLERHGADELRFAPYGTLNTPKGILEVRNSCARAEDPPGPPLKAEHQSPIEYAVRALCASSKVQSTRERAERVLRTFMQGAVAVHGHTLTGARGGQRYEAAMALRRPRDPASGQPIAPRYLVLDAESGEIAARVSDLGEAARAALAGGLRRGELEEMFASLGFTEGRIDGHALPGKAGRSGPHAVAQVLRGSFVITDPDLLDESTGEVTAVLDDDDEAVSK